MENFGNRATYGERLKRVTNYIYDHLDDDLDLDTLADVACLSPYHWHRTYRALYGETVAQTVKRLRLQRAAADLANGDAALARIAARAGYDSEASFNRAFKAVFGLPPARYRRSGSHTKFDDPQAKGDSAMYDIEIRQVDDFAVAYLEHRGPFLEIGRTFDILFGTLGARNLIAPDLRPVAVYFDDPDLVPAAELKSRSGVVIGEGFPVEPPLEQCDVAGGRYAVLRHKGPYADMKAAYDWLFGKWLVQSGHEAAEGPVFEAYLNSPRDTRPSELRTDIHLPLRELLP